MSDAERPGASRRRPSYGLPGPQADASPGSQGQTGPTSAQPTQPAQSVPYGAPAPQAEPLPYGAPAAGPAPAPAPPRRRKGLVMLIVGLVLLLVVGPLMTIGGIVWGVGSLVSDTAAGPTAMEGGELTMELPASDMLLIYVPSADADAAQCTLAEGDAQTVPSSSTVTFPDGTEYEQIMGVAAVSDTTVTISCTGTDGAAYMGPYGMLDMMGPLLIGVIVGVLAGLVGLVLTIIGIVRLVRSGRR